MGGTRTPRTPLKLHLCIAAAARHHPYRDTTGITGIPRNETESWRHRRSIDCKSPPSGAQPAAIHARITSCDGTDQPPRRAEHGNIRSAFASSRHNSVPSRSLRRSFIPLTVTLIIIISFSSPALSFVPHSKPSFSANPFPLQPFFFFFRTDYTIPRTFTASFEHISVFTL